MECFNFFKKNIQTNPVVTSINPYNNSTIDHIYNLLFCDNPELYKHNLSKPYSYPFDILFSKESTPAEMQPIINDTNLDPQVKILAYKKQLAMGYLPTEKKLLAVIVEVGLNNGLNVFASFYDGTAIFINQRGDFLNWKTTDDIKAKGIAKQLFNHSLSVVNQIEAWNKPRRSNPQKGDLKITFLASDGLYFGEGSIGVLFNDSMASPALETAFELEKYIREKSSEQNQKAKQSARVWRHIQDISGVIFSKN
jgi:hypothetical protein